MGFGGFDDSITVLHLREIFSPMQKVSKSSLRTGENIFGGGLGQFVSYRYAKYLELFEEANERTKNS
jgi:hypothetical protein